MGEVGVGPTHPVGGMQAVSDKECTTNGAVIRPLTPKSMPTTNTVMLSMCV